MNAPINHVGTASINATANLTKNRLVSLTGGVCAADAKPFGANVWDVTQGDTATVAFAGIVALEAGASIAAGAKLKSDASGKVITWASSGEVVGFALEAGANGDIIRVLLA